jgi:DNA polymerase family A
VRVAVVPGPGQSGLLYPLDDGPPPEAEFVGARPLALALAAELLAAARTPLARTPSARTPAEPGAEPLDRAVLVPDLAAAVRARERTGSVRWVWPATTEIYPPLWQAGVRVERSHDVALTEGLLLAREGRPGEPTHLAAAAARLHGLPVPERPRPPAAGPQASLFDEPDEPDDGLATAAAGLADLIAVDRSQRERIAADEHPGRFDLLVAAESAGALAAVEMTVAGLPWRPDVHDRLLTDVLGARPPASAGPLVRPPRLADLAGQITTAFGLGWEINPDSPAQIARALEAEGVRVSSTRTSVLREIDHPAIPLLVEYKELSRLHAAFGWSWLDTWVSGGRFRPEYVVGGVVSGRWASRGGGALQIPKVLRRAVVADPGWVLVVADAAQLEPRVLAALAGDEAFAQAAAAGDLYSALASAFGGDRAMAKVALLSAMYGGSGGASGQALAVLRRRFPQASAFVEAAAQAGEQGATVRSVLGRTCPPPSAAWRSATAGPADPGSGGDPDDGDPGPGPEQARAERPGTASTSGAARAAQAARARGRFTRNFVVQASAADWALALLASLRRRLAALDAAQPAQPGPAVLGPHLVFFQHDEVIVHCPAGLADQVVAATAEAAQEAGRLLFGPTRVSFPMTTAVVDCYADAK